MQLTLFPEDTGMLEREGTKIGLTFYGPHPALIVQGDDKLGALAEIHGQLGQAGVSVYASSGVADGRGSLATYSMFGPRISTGRPLR